MNIIINGKTFDLPMASTLGEALVKANIKPEGIATALNGKVIPAAVRDKTVLTEGDKIVIIKAFYGG